MPFIFKQKNVVGKPEVQKFVGAEVEKQRGDNALLEIARLKELLKNSAIEIES